MTIRPMTPAEQLYAYRQSPQITAQTGGIGHLYAELDSVGSEFYSEWEDYRSDRRTEEFQAELDSVIETLRYDEKYENVLKDRTRLAEYGKAHPECKFAKRLNPDMFGFRADTERYSYLFRLNPIFAETNIHVYPYERQWLDRHMRNAERGVRFITPNYEEKFRVPDGDLVRITTVEGEHRDHAARFIDDYHVELTNGFGSNLYHVCELAERLERGGVKVIPLRSSLPEKCFVYVESTDEIGVVTRGETGYSPTGIKPEGVSKREGEDALNEAQGITKAQTAAMSAGSLFGWDTKAADPANYNEEGVLMKKSRDRGDAR